ncbi:MAG: bifunctional ornithine acetyltransferase/N-acetylglutamate synthase, partial [Burkholderiales bacterium]
MAVNLAPPDPAALEPIAGVALGVTMAGIRKVGRRDLLVMRLAPGSTIAGVFTKNRFCAAPVTLALRHLAAGWEARGLVVNTGNANAGTGEDGIARARAVCEGLARALGCAVEQVLPFSTGVIMEPLPVERILDGLPAAVADLREANWAQAAEAIMTTDTVPKAASQRAVLSGGEVRVTGIAKGAGMIRPDMATMLAFVATDAVVARADLERLLRGAT